MNSMIKILFRYVASAAGVALVLLVLNLGVFFAWLIKAKNIVNYDYPIRKISENLILKDGNYELSDDGEEMIKQGYLWAMLLDHQGRLVWSENLPGDVPGSYSVSEVASFTRWYLNDYPVYVWQHPQGLFVLGKAKDSVWKHDIEMESPVFDQTLKMLPVVIILNIIAAFCLSLIFGFRFFYALQPLSRGIEEMAERKPVKLSNGGVLGDLAVKLNQTSTRLQTQEAALQKRDDARTAWIAGISHDIRTPLSMVMGYASQMENNEQLSQNEREQARIIRRQSEKIKSLVSDLNLASKLEYEMQPLCITRVDLAALLRSVITDFLNNGLAAEYPIDLRIHHDARYIKLAADKQLLQRAISNLVDNSIQHNAGGCSITLAVEKDVTTCCIIISDNGVGYSQEILESLKNPENNTFELPSHGLGLTLVRQIMKAHGGTVTFANLPERGCTALLRLPVDANVRE